VDAENRPRYVKFTPVVAAILILPLTR